MSLLVQYLYCPTNGDSPFHAFLNNKGRNSFWSSCHISLCIYNLQKMNCSKCFCFPNAARTKILRDWRNQIPDEERELTLNMNGMHWPSAEKTNLWHTGFLVFNSMRCCYSYVQTSLMSRFKQRGTYQCVCYGPVCTPHLVTIQNISTLSTVSFALHAYNIRASCFMFNKVSE